MTKKASNEQKSAPPIDFCRPCKTNILLEIAESGGKGDLNRGRYSNEELAKMQAAYDEGNGPGIVLYQPSLMELAMSSGRNIITSGRGEQEKVALPILRHTPDIRKRCNPDRLVETKLGTAILGIDGINPQISGNYAFVMSVAKSLIFANNAEVVNLVGLINSHPYIERLEHGGEIVWGTSNSVTWGHLVADCNRLTHEEIRSLPEGNHASFVALGTPILGSPINVVELSENIKLAMEMTAKGESKTSWDQFGYDDSDKGKFAVKTNIGTLTRCSPVCLSCYGFRGVQAGIPLFNCFPTEDRHVNMAIGARLPIAYVETVWTYKARMKAAKVEQPTEAVEVIESVATESVSTEDFDPHTISMAEVERLAPDSKN